MKSAIFAGYLMKRREGGSRTPDECIRLCREAGFDTVDWSPDYSRETWQEDAKQAAVAAEKYGVRIIQSHTPYNFYKRGPVEDFQTQLMQSVETARILGVKDLVFHFDEYHPEPGGEFDSEKAIDIIYDIMGPSVERTAKYGINAAIETIIEDHIRVPQDKRSHFGGDFDELLASIKRFNDPHVTCCWDFGHALLNYSENHEECIARLGSLITCTHVHDNYYGKDLHLMPFMGNARWESLIPALKATGYDGALTFEVGYGSLPEKIVPEFLKMSYDAMNILCEM